MRNFIRNHRAEGNYLASVIMLITVMMATIIGAVVFFAFATGTAPMQTSSQTFTGTGENTSVFYWKLSVVPGGTPAWNLTISGSAVATKYGGASNYTFIAANNTIKTNAQFFRYGYTTLVITFANHAKDSVDKVILYAIIVFAMIAIVPMIMVGGLMLRSLGFMGGGTGKI
jgi:hypothetical protein